PFASLVTALEHRRERNTARGQPAVAGGVVVVAGRDRLARALALLAEADAAVDAARVVEPDAADALVERRRGELVLRAALALLVGRRERGTGRRDAGARGAALFLRLELPGASLLRR